MKPEDAEEYTQALGQVVAGGWRHIALAQRLGVPKALGLSVDEWVKQRVGGYVRLSVEERKHAVVELKKDGHSQREIAAVVGVDAATVSRDLAETPVANATRDEKSGRIQNQPVADATQAEPLDVIAGMAVTEDARKQSETKAARAKREESRELERTANAAKVAAVSDPRELLKVGRFATIVLDPPWDFGDEGDVNHVGRGKHNFASMPLDQILELPVDALADEHCHVYLWITNRSLPKGFRLLEAWGFRYVTCLTWVKPSFGIGNYFRGQTEQVLFGIKGSQPLKRKDVGTAFEAPRGDGGHSSKPKEFYDLVESCSPGPYLEFFQREPRDGWTGWGEDSKGEYGAA